MIAALRRRFAPPALAVLCVTACAVSAAPRALTGATRPASSRAIAWQPSFAEARKVALERSAPIFVAIHVPGVRASEDYIARHLRDKRITKLCRETVNVFACEAPKSGMSGVSAKRAQACFAELRTELFEIAEDKWVRPQPILLDAQGKALVSLPEHASVGELEWALVWALSKLRPDFEWKLSEAARAAEKTIFAAKPFAGLESERPPSEEELEKATEELSKGGRLLWRRGRELLPKLVWSDDTRVLKFGETALAFTPGALRREVLDLVRRRSPSGWWKVVTPHVASRDARTRISAARALAVLGFAKAAAALSKQARKKDETERVRLHFLLAQVRITPRDKTVIRSIDGFLKSKDAKRRALAVVAASRLERRKKVTEFLGRALADADPFVRRTAAYAIAWRRDATMRTNLEIVAKNESDEDTKALLEAATRAMRGGDLDAFAAHRRALEEYEETSASKR